MRIAETASNLLQFSRKDTTQSEQIIFDDIINQDYFTG